MASNDCISLSMTTMTLEEPTKEQIYTLFVPVGIRERCSADQSGQLSNVIFNTIIKLFTTNGVPKRKTLDHTQSLAVLAEMGLFGNVTPGRETTKVNTQQFETSEEPKFDIENSDTASQLSQDSSSEALCEQDPNVAENQGRTVWTHEAILLLIDRRREHSNLFENSAVTQKQAWRKIAEELSEKGYQFTLDECSKKFRNLKGRYKAIKEKNNQTGRGRQSWRYYDILDEMFSGDPAVTPTTVVSSMPSTSRTAQVRADQEDEPSTSTPRVPRKRRREIFSEEPGWLAQYQADQKKMHEEKMLLEERRVKALESLVEYLRNEKNSA